MQDYIRGEIESRWFDQVADEHGIISGKAFQELKAKIDAYSRRQFARSKEKVCELKRFINACSLGFYAFNLHALF